jgi:hypothetical protein
MKRSDLSIRRHVAEINELGKRSWQGTGCTVVDFDPPRGENGCPKGAVPEECCPMHRFMFMADCFTSWDAKILPGGRKLIIIYNGHFRLRYPEDAVFAVPAFASGAQVTWAKIKQATRSFVALTNMRLQPDFPSTAIWNEVTPEVAREYNMINHAKPPREAVQDETAKA